MRVFGREKERRALSDVLFSGPRSGPVTALLSGEAGIGKSSLARSFRDEVAQRGGLFFEIPCSPVHSPEKSFSSALEETLTQVRDSLKRDEWRDKLRPFSDVLNHRLPKLAEWLGLDSPVDIARNASQQRLRFRQTARLLFQLLQRFARPIVLFVDDIQWADQESFELQRFLAEDRELPRLRLLIAARSEELNPNFERELIAGADLHLELSGLSAQAFQEVLLARTTLSPTQSKEKAKQLQSRLGGNPLYLTAAISLLSAGRSDEVFSQREEILVKALELLPASSLELLGSAACVGKRFHPRLLSSISSVPESELRLRLETYVDRGFLLRQGELYEFRHDKLRDAVGRLYPGRQAARTHQSLGNLLLTEEGGTLNGLEHLGQSLDLMNREQKVDFARQSLEGAHQAAQAGAATTAHRLCRRAAIALEVWPAAGETGDVGEAWERQAELAIRLCLQAAEAAEGSGDEELWRTPVALLRKHTTQTDILARATLCEVRALAFEGEHLQAIKCCERFLQSLPNYKPLPSRGFGAAVRSLRLLQKIRRLARGNFQGLKRQAGELPSLKHELMTVQVHSSVHAAIEQVPLYTIRMCESVLEDGASDGGAHSLLSFSLAVGWKLRQHDLARQVSAFCAQLVEGSTSSAALQTELAIEISTGSQARTTFELARRMERLHEKFLMHGDFQLATAALSAHSMHVCLSGAPLPNLEESVSRMKTLYAQHRAKTGRYISDLLTWALETSPEGSRSEPPPQRDPGIHHLVGQAVEMQTYLVTGSREAALRTALEKPADGIPILGQVHIYYWLLRAISLYWGGRTDFKSRLARSVTKLKSWCKVRPDRVWILNAAEGLRAPDKEQGLAQLRRAQSSAALHGCLHMSALLAEVLARECSAQEAVHYQAEANRLLARWRGQPESSSGSVKLSEAIETLANQTTPETLARALLEQAQAQTGAEQVALVSCRSTTYAVMEALKPCGDNGLPLSVIDQVVEMKESLTLHGPELLSFADDPYIRSRPSLNSLLVVPIAFQSQLGELLYLESEKPVAHPQQEQLELLVLQWKLLQLQMERSEELERQRELLERVRETWQQETLQTMALEARRSALATFLGVASHDLKAPLATIGLWASRLDESPEKANIEAACSRASGLIHDYLDSMALELENEIRLDKKACDLAQLVEQEIDHQLDSLEPALRRRTQLRWELESVPIEADPTRFRQVIANLLSNALKHCPQGTPISVSTGLDEGDALMVVADEGPGVDLERRSSLFGAYGQSAKGTGLGLWIVKTIAEAHGGRVRYRGLERGSAFEVRLPAKAV